MCFFRGVGEGVGRNSRAEKERLSEPVCCLVMKSLHHRADPCDRDTGEGGRRVTILISVASGTILSRVTMGLVAGPRADTGAGSPGGCCGVVCVGGLRGNSQ